ncbi:MAG: hypothetical protein HFG76_09255 [Hungatella sp.]|nr:hypothetical protein [Hungatella sp.]MCI9638158.1 hypothetical protein [Hungatella sp.]
MEKTYICLKDNPVLEICNYRCRILDYDRLPVSLRYEGVGFDDVMHGWTENRAMSVGRTNAKKLLAGFGISQSNPYLVARLFHFTSLTDCYWLKEEGDRVRWKDVSLFRNKLEKTVSATALMGVPGYFKDKVREPVETRIHTPELTVQGLAAKAWIREQGGLYLYKVGKKELAASRILDALGILHVGYEEVAEERLARVADQKRIDSIRNAGEKVVKCRIISSEQKALVPWEDFQMYCAYHDMDEYAFVKEQDPRGYYSMLIADYILGNEDRHGANFGFFMDNRTGKLGKLYPLMDHDHGFSEDDGIISQTSETKETLETAAFKAAKMGNWGIDYQAVLGMEKPEELSGEQWDGVLGRIRRIFCEK